MTLKPVHFLLLSLHGRVNTRLVALALHGQWLSHKMEFLTLWGHDWILRGVWNLSLILSHISSAISDFLLSHELQLDVAMGQKPEMTGSQGFYWGIRRNGMSNQASRIKTLLLVTLSFQGFVSTFCISWTSIWFQRPIAKGNLAEDIALASRLSKNTGLFFLDTLSTPLSSAIIIFERKNRRLFLVARRVSPFWTFGTLEF